MRLIHNVKGISNFILILLLLVSFIVGALSSYIWTMGGYAPSEFHLPKANVAIESVEFYAENVAFFNVTLLNSSYSTSEVTIEQILVSTNDGLLHKVTNINPSLPSPLTPSNSQTFKAYWNWANYTGQSVNVIAFVADGSGATFQKITPFMNLTIASVNFDPAVSTTSFTVTVQSMGSQTFMNITKMTLNGEDVSVLPLLPYTLDVNASATFTLFWNWSNLQGTNATVSVETLQGFTAHKSQFVPEVP